MNAALRIALLVLLAWAAPLGAQPLRIAVARGPVSLSVYMAQANDLFAKAGVAVQAIECRSGRHCVQLLQDGQADLATGAELLVSLAALERSELAIVATLSSSSEHIKLVARRDVGGAHDAKAMRGKRNATVPGTSAQYFLDSWLLVHQVDAAQIGRVSLPPERLVEAFARGEIDALAVWEPIAADALKAGDARVIPAPRIYKQHFALIGQRSLLAAREAELSKALRALDRAATLIRARPDHAKAVLMQRLQVERAFVDAHWHEHDYRLTLEQSLITTMDQQQRWATHERGLPRAAANAIGAIEPSLLRRAAPGAVTLVVE
jgi:ABC-type nitrate/sulfonate/bicarbonate transport system substrate-binding protein